MERRIIVDNDGCDVFFIAGSSYEEFIKPRFERLRGTGATTMFYTTISSGFGVFSHNTRRGSLFRACPPHREHNVACDIIERGTDSLQYAIRFCRENGMEIFWGMRMNDTHDGTDDVYSDITFEQNAFKMQHPEALMGTKENRPPCGTWSAVDYGQKLVRDAAFGYVEEVCQNYDIDGVHLDFFRHPVLFRNPANGLAASQEEIAACNELMQRIHEMLKREGARRGREIKLSVRVPDSVEYAKFLGFDLEEWLKNGWIDLLCTTSYIQLNRWEYSVELGHRYGVPVYPSLDETRVRMFSEKANALRADPAGMRARCTNVFHAGADGVLLFNYILDAAEIPERFDVVRQVAHPEQMSRLPRRYFASFRGSGFVAGGAPDHRSYLRVPVLNPGAPERFAPYIELPVYVGDPSCGADAALYTLLGMPCNCEAELNGHAITLSMNVEGFVMAKIPPEWVRAGENIVRITAPPENVLLDLFIELSGAE